MIKFFRHIRKLLLMENKTSKYFKYAIGEIVLVVIGILIALQINNWNEKRLQQQSELKFLKGIQAEFKLNKAYLLSSNKMNQEVLKTGKEIMNLMNQDVKILRNINIDSLIFQIFEYGGFEISENTILEVMQVGQLQNLENDQLKSFILEWSQQKIKIERNRITLTDKSDYLIKYLMTRYPLKNIDKYGVLAWKNPSKFDIDKYAIFTDLEFENSIDDLLYNLTLYNNRIIALLGVIDGILKNSSIKQ